MINAVSSAPAASALEDRQKLKAVAQQFEAVFLRQMISSMRTASLGDGLLDSDASNQFRDMADARTADAMAGKGALGIAEMLLKQFGVTSTPITARAEPVEAIPSSFQGRSALRQAQGERGVSGDAR